MIETVKFRLVGISPLMLQSERLVNPRDPLKQLIKPIAAKGKAKTDDDMLALARLEFEAHLYMNGNGPMIPGQNIERMFFDAGKSEKKGQHMKRGLRCLNESDILYKGPRDVEGLWKDQKYIDYRSVGLNKARVMRCRPKFPEWSLEPEVTFDTEVFNDVKEILRFAIYAGKYLGLGTYRPRFGRFEVKIIK